MTLARPLLALIALAMLLAPSAMLGASAAVPASHHAQTAMPAHCDERGTPAADDNGEQDCCAALCVGADFATAAAMTVPLANRPVNARAGDQAGRSVLARLPTPPPRSA